MFLVFLNFVLKFFKVSVIQKASFIVFSSGLRNWASKKHRVILSGFFFFLAIYVCFGKLNICLH